MTQDKYQYACPKCGGHTFQLVVPMLVDVEFTPGEDHSIYDGPYGDTEFSDATQAICNDCHHSATLGEMKIEGETV
jgi:Zn finger protein HypA/HybF involved in hydrogenase expression